MGQTVVRMVLVATAYVLLAWIALGSFLVHEGNICLIWPSSGLALAALLIGGRSYAVAIFAGAFMTGLLQRHSLLIAFTIATGCTLAALTGWLLLSKNKYFNKDLYRPRDYVSLCVAGAISTMVSSAVGVATLSAVGIVLPSVDALVLLNRWLGDTLGILLVTPLMLVWRELPRFWYTSVARFIEAISCFGVLVVLVHVQFMDWGQEPASVFVLHCFTFLSVTWVATRFGRHGVTLALTITIAHALMGIAQGKGFFAHDFAQAQMVNFWMYAITLAFIGFSLALSISHRQRIESVLHQSNAFQKEILNSVAAEIAVIDAKGVIQMTNERWREFSTGHAQDPCNLTQHTEAGVDYLSLCGSGPYSCFDGVHDARQGIEAVQQGRLPTFSLEYPCHSLAGGKHWYNMVVLPFGQANCGHVTITHSDITALKHTKESLRENLSALQSILETTQDGFWRANLQGELTDVNPAYIRQSGYTREELLTMHIRDLEAAMNATEIADRIVRLMKSGHDQFETQHRRKDGSVWNTEVSLSMSKTAGGYFFAFLRDITDRKLAEVMQHRHQAMLARTEGIAHIGSWEWDVATDIVTWSEEMFRIFKLNPADGAPSFAEHGKLYNPTDLQRLQEAVGEATRHGKPYELELHAIRSDGVTRICLARGQTEMNADKQVTHLHGSLQDITERKQMEEQVRYLAFYDALTQLPNRRMLCDRLSQVMAASKRSLRYGAIMILDLDNFKPVNDQHGHLVGDVLLTEAAKRLSGCVREVDTVARFGGDEFVVLLSDMDVDQAQSAAQAQAVAEKIRLALSEPYVLPITTENQAQTTVMHHCSVSIGIALFMNTNASQEDLFKWADVAMYQAKADGRNTIRMAETGGQRGGLGPGASSFLQCS